MTTQIQKIAMCRSKPERLTSVAPVRMFTSQAACAWLTSVDSPSPIQMHGCRDIAGSPYDSCYPADCHRHRRKSSGQESFPDASYVFDQSDFAVAPPLSRWLRRRLH